MLEEASITKINSDKSYLNSYETKIFKKNEIIYLKGQEIDNIYIILDGKVESVLEKNENIKENITLCKGSSLGLMDLILNRDYTKSMIAKNLSVLAIIKKQDLSNLLIPDKCETILLKSLAIDIDAHNPKVWS